MKKNQIMLGITLTTIQSCWIDNDGEMVANIGVYDHLEHVTFMSDSSLKFEYNNNYNQVYRDFILHHKDALLALAKKLNEEMTQQ